MSLLSFFGTNLLLDPIKRMTGLGEVAVPFQVPGNMSAGGILGSAMDAGKTALGGLKEYGPGVATAVDAAYKANSMTQGQPQQYAPAQFAQGQGFGGLLTPMEQFDPEKRRRDQQMAVQGLLGGYRG